MKDNKNLRKDKEVKNETTSVSEENVIQEIVSLEELLSLVKQSQKNSKKYSELLDQFDKIIIRGYIPILVKTTLVLSLIIKKNIDVSEYQELRVANLYKDLFFTVLLGGYTNIDVSDEKLHTFDNYDILYPTLGVYLLQFCEDDYKLVIEMLKDSMNFYNIKEIADTISFVDFNKTEESIKSNIELINLIKENENTVDKLLEISKLNSPFTTKLVENVKEMAKDISYEKDQNKE